MNVSILITNDKERDRVLEKLEREGWEWEEDMIPTEYKPECRYNYYSNILSVIRKNGISYTKRKALTHKNRLSAQEFLGEKEIRFIDKLDFVCAYEEAEPNNKWGSDFRHSRYEMIETLEEKEQDLIYLYQQIYLEELFSEDSE